MPRRGAETRKRRFLEAILRGATIASAAEHAGVNRSTPYNWGRADAEFAMRWDEVRESRMPQLKDAAFELALEGNVQLMKFLINLYERPRLWSGSGGGRLAGGPAAGRHAGEGPVLAEIRIVMPGDEADEEADREFFAIDQIDG